MSQKIKSISTEEQLLQARERGLKEAAEVSSIKAHGKLLGMDTFSWNNPHIDALATFISSLPFPVQWVTHHQLVKDCLNTYPEIAMNIHSIVVHDKAELNLDKEMFVLIPNITFVEGVEEALELVKAMQQEKSVFLFTGNPDWKPETVFEQFIERNR